MPQRIIVIDDTPEIVGLYEELLTDEGYDVVATFAGPPTEPAVIERHQPDLIIMDWLFGNHRTGMQMLDMLKTYPPTAPLPIIVCSAAERTLREVEGTLTQQGVCMLHKPFAIDDLLAMIQEVLA